MRKDRLELATHLHFQKTVYVNRLEIETEENVGAALQKSKEYWATFVQLMADAGDPVPEDFHWRDHTDLL